MKANYISLSSAITANGIKLASEDANSPRVSKVLSGSGLFGD